MLGSCIALMAFETILWPGEGVFFHDAIPRDLRNHTGRGDAHTDPVAAYEGRLLDGEGFDGQAIDKCVHGS